jgi:hypothetical protein
MIYPDSEIESMQPDHPQKIEYDDIDSSEQQVCPQVTMSFASPSHEFLPLLSQVCSLAANNKIGTRFTTMRSNPSAFKE